MRKLFVLLATSFALGCVRSVSSPDPENRFAATVFADSAVFLYPTPIQAVWKWNVLDYRGYGAEQFMWQAIWDVSREPPYSLGQGFGVGVIIGSNSEPQSGSIQDVLRVSKGRALVPPPPRLDVAYAVEREDSLFITENRGSVRVSLRRSPTLSRLQMSHPDSLRLEVRVPVINFQDKKVVRVQYRNGT